MISVKHVLNLLLQALPKDDTPSNSQSSIWEIGKTNPAGKTSACQRVQMAK